MLTFLDPRTTVSFATQTSGIMPPWVPGSTQSGIAFWPEDRDGDYQIILPPSPLISSCCSSIVSRRNVSIHSPHIAIDINDRQIARTGIALKRDEEQPYVGSLCSTCGQATVCSSCQQCHYCNDVDLPCAHMQNARRSARIAAQFHQMTWLAEEHKTPESLPEPIIGPIVPQSGAEADILRLIRENLGLPTDLPSSEKKEACNV